MVSMNEKTTTIAVYVGDRDWLQERQLRSASPGRWPVMPEVIHSLIEAVRGAEAGEGA